MSDLSQVDRVKSPQFGDLLIADDRDRGDSRITSGSQVTVSAQAEFLQFVLEPHFAGDGLQDFESFRDDFRARSVSTNDCDSHARTSFRSFLEASKFTTS